MSTPVSILGISAITIGVFAAAFHRLRAKSVRKKLRKEPRELGRFYDASKIGGVPLKHALDERSGPGAAIRDHHTYGPPPRIY